MQENPESRAPVALEDYVGKLVRILLSGSKSFEAVLETADARGVVVSYTTAESGDHIRFYPWHQVEYIHLKNTPKEKRRAGFHQAS